MIPIPKRKILHIMYFNKRIKKYIFAASLELMLFKLVR